MKRLCRAGKLKEALELEEACKARADEEAGWEIIGIMLRDSPSLAHTTGTGRCRWDALKGTVEIWRPEGRVLVWDIPAGEIRCTGVFFQRHVDSLDVCLGALGFACPPLLRELAGDRRTEEGDVPIPHLKHIPSPVGRVILGPKVPLEVKKGSDAP